jgi:hypothetical protein
MPDFRTCPKCGRESAAWRFKCPTCGNSLVFAKKVTVEIRDHHPGELEDLIEDIEARREGKPAKQRVPRPVTKREVTIQREVPLDYDTAPDPHVAAQTRRGTSGCLVLMGIAGALAVAGVILMLVIDAPLQVMAGCAVLFLLFGVTVVVVRRG